MLQILDDGRITDSQGRTVDFKNTVIVMTSNIGAKALTDAGPKLGFATGDKKAEADADKAYEQAKETVLEELRRTFRPEFLNRIDDIIVFRALTEQDIEEVARRMLKTVENVWSPWYPFGCNRRSSEGACQRRLRPQIWCTSAAPSHSE